MIQGISVNGELHQLDYNTLANKPTIPDITDLSSRVSSLENGSGLPSVTSSDQGKVLAVDSNGDWNAVDAPTGLPNVTLSDKGKALTVKADGSWGFNAKLTEDYISQMYQTQQLMYLHLLPVVEADDRILISDGNSWTISDFSVIELRETVLSLVTQLAQLQERVSRLASSLSDTEVYAANEKLTLSGAGASVTGEKLAINDSAANVTGEKLSI